jgi:hypothetical protein
MPLAECWHCRASGDPSQTVSPLLDLATQVVPPFNRTPALTALGQLIWSSKERVLECACEGSSAYREISGFLSCAVRIRREVFMPTCPVCGGSGMISVGGVKPPYRPCPECAGSGRISDQQESQRMQERARRNAKKDKGFAWVMLLVGLGLLYGLGMRAEDSTTQWIGIGGAVVCFLLFAKNV